MPVITIPKCTIYKPAMFGMARIECATASFEICRYAQYPSAIALRWKAKGMRKEVGEYLASRPYALIVDGFGHPAAPDQWSEPQLDPRTGLTGRVCRYSSFDPKIQTDFDKFWAEYEQSNPKLKVLADFRGFNTMQQQIA